MLSRYFRLIAGFCLLVLLSLIPPHSVVLALMTWNDIKILQNSFDTDRVPMTTAARALVRDGRAWQTELAPLLAVAPDFAWVPVVGGDFAQSPRLAAFVNELFNAVEPALTLYDALQEKLASQKSFGAALIALAQQDSAEIQGTRETLERVKQARAAIDERDLSPRAHALLQTTDRALQEWDAALRLIQETPVLLGNDAPRRYLVLAQNNDELRPTGGFISAVGVLRVERGEISVEWFGDSFAADDLTLIHPPPPAPLQKYMWASQWLLRDANWYADFPTSAALARSMYANDHHVKTDGIIAIDTRFLPRLVGALDNLTLEGQPLAQANIIALLKASWQPMPPGDMSAAWFTGARKNFLAELMNEMMARVRGGNVRPNALAQAVWRGLREKSLQLYFDDQDAEQALVDADWAGAVQASGGDSLFVVDSNVGFNKVNATVTREIAYDVRLNGQDSAASVEITYNNPSRTAEGACDLLKQHKDKTYASMEQSCYWDYVRVLAPRGSRFLAAGGVKDAGMTDDVDHVTAFGGYAVIPRSTTQTINFRYALPARLIQDDTYTLQVQQQAGAAPSPLTVRVTLPDGYRVRGATLAFTMRGNSELEFHTILNQDMMIKIYLAPEGTVQ